MRPTNTASPAEQLDRRAESVPKIGGDVPRGLLYPPEEASAEDGWLNRPRSSAKTARDSVRQPRGAGNRATYKTCQTANHAHAPPHNLPFIDIDQ